eukprot:3140545-Pyramimonas_sp.AAC.1
MGPVSKIGDALNLMAIQGWADLQCDPGWGLRVLGAHPHVPGRSANALGKLPQGWRKRKVHSPGMQIRSLK